MSERLGKSNSLSDIRHSKLSDNDFIAYGHERSHLGNLVR